MPLTTVSQGLLSTDAQYTGFKNRLINGDMVIDQRNNGASVALSGSSRYPVDRFVCFYTNSGGAATGQQSSVAPTGFTNSLLYSVTTGAAINNGDYPCIQQNIEGFNTADLGWGAAGASTVTLSFWVRSSLTGTFSGSLQNSAANRSYVYTYTISAANTWEYKTVTIPGDTTGTWLKNNGVGVRVYWNMGFEAPSTTSTINTWLAGSFNGAVGGVTPSTTTGATFYLTGVQLEKGNTATSFDYLDYGTELALCQRYTQVLRSSADVQQPICAGFMRGTTLFIGSYSFPVTMRAAPSLTSSSGTNFFHISPGGTDFDGNVVNIEANTYVSSNAVNLGMNMSSGTATTGFGATLYFNAGSNRTLVFSSEL